MQSKPQVKLTCSYSFCVAHQLTRADWTPEKNREVFGHCANIHGHQYKIDLHLEGRLSSKTGMLINGYEVDKIVKPFFTKNFDHKFLNQDVAFFKDHQPTAEWISVWIFDELKNKFPEFVKLKQVSVYETPELKVSYQGQI